MSICRIVTLADEYTWGSCRNVPCTCKRSEVGARSLRGNPRVRFFLFHLSFASISSSVSSLTTQARARRWFAQDPTRRAKVVLATKVMGYAALSDSAGNRKVTLGAAEVGKNGRPKETARLDKASIVEACDASLVRLQTDYIDLYQLHWPDRYVCVCMRLGVRGEMGGGGGKNRNTRYHAFMICNFP